jgi:hypothetical protein
MIISDLSYEVVTNANIVGGARRRGLTALAEAQATVLGGKGFTKTFTEASIAPGFGATSYSMSFAKL